MPRQKRSRAYNAPRRYRIAGRPSRFRRTNNVVERDVDGMTPDGSHGRKEERKMGGKRKEKRKIGLGKNLQGARYSNTARAKPIYLYTPVFTPGPG